MDQERRSVPADDHSAGGDAVEHVPQAAGLRQFLAQGNDRGGHDDEVRHIPASFRKPLIQNVIADVEIHPQEFGGFFLVPLVTLKQIGLG
ncbi:hypothetical protein SDC9_180138 [bioreactor metagenome]|uniref:Uncharacterized protein n=1 Tax=bioreactor metagenome TaxID=1076179 RepID=A0A645H0Z7_9ZZZZ